MATRKIKTIYLVDDSDDEIFMAKIFFQRQRIGPHLITFSRLEQLYETMENSPDFEPERSLIVIDLNLTVCKGTEGIIQIRGMKAGSNVLAGISTGSEDPADRQLASDAGADFFVGKPLDRAALLTIADCTPKLTAQEDAEQTLHLYRD